MVKNKILHLVYIIKSLLDTHMKNDAMTTSN